MKFARHLAEEGNEPELHSLYKQLKKSLRIFEGPADAGSTVDVPHTLPSSDDEDEEPRAEAGPSRAMDADAAGAGQPGAAQPPAAAPAGAAAAAAAAAAAQPAQGVAQQPQAQPAQPRRPDPEQEARFVALVEQCVQQLNEDYLAREEMLVIKADLAQQACAAAHSRAEQLEAYTSIVNVHGELVLLCHWSMCAYTGIVKILKKHHKRTGQRVHSALLANLMSQPFCCLEEVRGLVRQAEQRIATLAAALGLPPSTAGAAAAAAVRDPAAKVQQLEQPAAAAAAAAAVAGAGLGNESPAVGESGAAAAQEAPMAADHSASGASSMEREQSAQQEQQAQQAQQEQQAEQVAAVDVVAASGAGAEVDPHAARRPSRINSAASDGSDRPGLKRDRSKVYAPVAKRRERDAPRVLKTSPAPQAQPASSGSSMQVSHSEGGAGAGQEDSAASGQRRTIMQRTKAALQLWKALRTNVSTPSTVAMQQPNLQPAAERQQ